MSVPEQNARAREGHAARNQTLLHEINERMQEADDDGFSVVMPVGEWIDAQLWPASARAAAVETWHSPRAELHHGGRLRMDAFGFLGPKLTFA
jgi:hypothetical protein